MNVFNTLRIGPPRGGPDRTSAKGDLVEDGRFRCLEITKIVASRPKCDLGVARSAPDVHFADSVEELSILRLRDRGAHFWDRISLCFSVILRDFGTFSPSKATPGTAKMNAF